MRRFVPLFVLVAACTGTIDGGGDPTAGSAGSPGGSDGPDAGAASAPGDAPPAGGFACRNQLPASSSGHHNAGQDCQQGCHDHGFTLSGTMYAGANSTTPLVGASVTVVDSGGKTFDMVTATNGNFYTSNAVTFPVTVTASSCPSVHAMSGAIASGSGGCNKSGCHTAAGQGRVSLP